MSLGYSTWDLGMGFHVSWEVKRASMTVMTVEVWWVFELRIFFGTPPNKALRSRYINPQSDCFLARTLSPEP